MQLRQEQQRLQTLHAQLEAWAKTLHTRSKKLRARMWSEHPAMLERSKVEADRETDKNNRRQAFFQRWFLKSRRVRPAPLLMLCTITHAVSYTHLTLPTN